ncbi:MAG TPA: hypothetical protein ENK98_09785 [Epsilonproteobacteria bacterium]|nr:hypothetical protein [Campylobacterota bacterium]
MFMIEPNPNKEMKILLRGIKQKLGHVPPHWELFATINPTRFKMFLDEINYLNSHPHIQNDFFTLLRYTIATDNGFTYCINLNRAFLLAKGYTLEQLHALEGSQKTLPLDERHQALFDAVMKAVYKPEEFTVEGIAALKILEWNDADIFDAVDHGAFLFRASKILKAYSKD